MQEESNEMINQVSEPKEGGIDWKDLVACAPLVLLAIPSSYGVGRYFNQIDPDLVSWVVGVAFESAYLGAIMFRQNRSQVKFLTVIVMAVTASVIFNVMDAAMEFRLLREGQFDWVGWLQSAFLGVFLPLVNLAYAFLMHEKKPQIEATTTPTANPEQQNQINAMQTKLEKIEQDTKKRDEEYRETHSQILGKLSDLAMRLSQPTLPAHTTNVPVAIGGSIPFANVVPTQASPTSTATVSLGDLLDVDDLFSSDFALPTFQQNVPAFSQMQNSGTVERNDTTNSGTVERNAMEFSNMENSGTERYGTVTDQVERNDSTVSFQSLATDKAVERNDTATGGTVERNGGTFHYPTTSRPASQWNGGTERRYAPKYPRPESGQTSVPLQPQPANSLSGQGEVRPTETSFNPMRLEVFGSMATVTKPQSSNTETGISEEGVTAPPANVVPFPRANANTARNRTFSPVPGWNGVSVERNDETERRNAPSGTVERNDGTANTKTERNDTASGTFQPLATGKAVERNGNDTVERNDTVQPFQSLAGSEAVERNGGTVERSTESEIVERNDTANSDTVERNDTTRGIVPEGWNAFEVAVLDDESLSLSQKAEKLWGQSSWKSKVSRKAVALAKARQQL